MKEIKRKFFDEKGSYSIETAVIMAIVFMVILAMITMAHMMYEQARINAIAQDAAERAGVIYSVAGKDMIVGRVNPEKFKETSPYWRLLNLNKESKKTAVEDYVNIKLNKFKLNTNQYAVTVEYKDYFVYKRVCVKIEGEYKIPFGGFLSDIILSDYTQMRAYAEATVTEQAEMIRNVDLVADIVGVLTEGTKIGEFLNKYRNQIDSISGKISGSS